MTRSEIFAAVKLMAQRPRTTDEDLQVYLLLTEAQMNLKLRDHPRNEVIAAHLQTADAETGNYSPLVPIPSNMSGLITLKQGDTLYPQYPPGGTEPSLGFVERGKCFQVFPAPGADTEYTITYHATLDPLDSDYAANWVSEWYGNAYVLGMLAELGSSVVHARRKEWNDQFLATLEDIRRQGWGQNFATAMRVRNYD